MRMCPSLRHFALLSVSWRAFWHLYLTRLHFVTPDALRMRSIGASVATRMRDTEIELYRRFRELKIFCGHAHPVSAKLPYFLHIS